MRKICIQNILNETACTKDVVYMSNYYSKYIWDEILKYDAKIHSLIDDFVIYNKLKIEYDNNDTHLSYQTLSLKPELKLGNYDGLGISPGFYNRFKDTLPTALSLNSWIMLIKNKKNIFWLDLYINFDNYHILKEIIDNKELFEQIPYTTIYFEPWLLEIIDLKELDNMLNIYMTN